MNEDWENEYTYNGGKIESLSDILDIMNRPDEFLSEIIDTDKTHHAAPLGRNHHGAPRPFPHGLWFRGQADRRCAPIPSVFRQRWEQCGADEKHRQFYDEREMFTDIRLRASHVDLRGFNNIELMCLMQHHALPTRLMDWSESPLVATFFATSRQYYESRPYYVQPEGARGMAMEGDAALYVLNAYRLNALTNLSLHPDANIFHPKDIDVVLRSLMAEHTYIENVFSKIYTLEYLANDQIALDVEDRIKEIKTRLRKFRHIVSKKDNIIDAISSDEILKIFCHRLSAPAAVIPRREHARMHAQLSCFTIHGGKLAYRDVFKDSAPDSTDTRRKGWFFIPPTIHLHQINGPRSEAAKLALPESGGMPPQFMKKFIISKFAVSRLMIELDRMGINESMIYPDIENQSRYVKRRWATIEKDKPIWSLPRLDQGIGTPEADKAETINEQNYMEKIYGRRNREP